MEMRMMEILRSVMDRATVELVLYRRDVFFKTSSSCDPATQRDPSLGPNNVSICLACALWRLSGMLEASRQDARGSEGRRERDSRCRR